MYVYLAKIKDACAKYSHSDHNPPPLPPLYRMQDLVSAAATIITKSTPYSSNNQNCLSHADTL